LLGLRKKNFIAESKFSVNCFYNSLILSGNYFDKSEKIICAGPDGYEKCNPEVKHADIVHIGEEGRVSRREKPVIVIMEQEGNYGHDLEDGFEFTEVAVFYDFSLR